MDRELDVQLALPDPHFPGGGVAAERRVREHRPEHGLRRLFSAEEDQRRVADADLVAGGEELRLSDPGPLT